MVWTSPYPPVEVGGATLHRMVLEAAARFGDRPALVDGGSGTTVSYRLLAGRVEAVAAGLAARGFRHLVAVRGGEHDRIATAVDVAACRGVGGPVGVDPRAQ